MGDRTMTNDEQTESIVLALSEMSIDAREDSHSAVETVVAEIRSVRAEIVEVYLAAHRLRRPKWTDYLICLLLIILIVK